ncbi:AAA domain-containing protein [Micromonospora matsumotoense]|uniref:AAA domain-containing protein n=1 Tax=Micromonospora matsumotoense TaxID=121616 RepID=UPI003D93C70D
MTAPLDLPERWVDELTGQWSEALRPTLHLSIFPNQLVLPEGSTKDDLKADLEQGLWLVAHRRRGWYRLGGDLFEVSVQSRPAEVAKHPLAVVHSVTEAVGVPPSVRMQPTVNIVPIFGEALCDLASIHKLLKQVGAVRARLGRGRPSPHLRRHGALRSQISKEYGDFGTMLDLLAERAARQPDIMIEGRVTADSAVQIELDRAPEQLRNRRITIQVDADEEYQTRVVRINGRVATVDGIRGWAVPEGTRVRVVSSSGFGMRQNAEALDRFKSGQVEGSWDDLAALLCDPRQLRAPQAPPVPERFFCDSDPAGDPLDDDQRRAVAGALATPHAYLIQGPPGTGKTSVISELIRQGIARGERVLMLAPSHVAVDEVLRRVGPKPGVRALRITWNSDKVDAALHPYLFDRVGHELAREALRTGGDKRGQWRWRLDELDRYWPVLAELAEVVEQERRAKMAYTFAYEEHVRLIEAHAAITSEAEERVTVATARVVYGRQREQEAVTAAATAIEQANHLTQDHDDRLRNLRSAAIAAQSALHALGLRPREWCTTCP